MGVGCSSSDTVIRASTSSLQDDEPPFKVVMLGPRNAGKTFLLYSWLLGRGGVHSTKPTEEFNVETVDGKSDLRFTVWDISGNPMVRHHQKRKYFTGAQAVVYVFDVTVDLKQAVEDIQTILDDLLLKDAPLLIIANQIGENDLPSDEDLSARLNVKKYLSDRRWHLSRVKLKSEKDVEDSFSDLQRLITT